MLQDPSNLASTDTEMEPVQLEEDFCGQPLEWSVQAMNPPKDRLEQAGTMLNELGKESRHSVVENHGPEPHKKASASTRAQVPGTRGSENTMAEAKPKGRGRGRPTYTTRPV